MRTTVLENLQSQLSAEAATEPLLVTRNGRVSGLYLPLESESETVEAENVRRDLASLLGEYISGLLETRGVSEAEVLEDFRAYRRDRR